MLKIIGQTIGKIFGTDQAASALIENVSNGLDKLVYTREEKAADHAAAVTEARQMVIKWLAATSGQNLARRLLALMITTVWLFQYICMMILSVLSVWVSKTVTLTTNGVDATVNIFHESSKIIGGYAENMNGAMMLILAFYFASPYMGSVVDIALKKFGGKSG